MAIDAMIRDNILEFDDIIIKVQVSSGPAYEPMQLSLRHFSPRNKEFLAVNRLDENSQGRILTVRRYASPLGLHADDVMLLKKKCSRHIQLIVASRLDSQDEENCERFGFSSKIFAVIDRYRRASSTILAAVSCALRVSIPTD
jgi:hypothetical protein